MSKLSSFGSSGFQDEHGFQGPVGVDFIAVSPCQVDLRLKPVVVRFVTEYLYLIVQDLRHG